MKKIIFAILIGVFALTISGYGASGAMLIPATDQAKDKAQAPEHSSVITETSAGEWELDRVDFIHYAKPTNPANSPKAEGCYKLMGVKWATTPVNFIINPTNPQELSEAFIVSAISTSTETWDAATSRELFNNSIAVDNAVQFGIQDFKNVVAFGNYPDANVIAVTSVWYTRVGRRIVEFDMLFDTDFAWGDATINPSLMDLANIATHELGHAVGLSDIYSTSCAYVTMYGYSTEGEVDKRTLEQPDITGLQKMYGI